MTRFSFETQWQVDAPVDRVWDVLLRADDWPAWWRGIRSVERLDAGEPSGVGMSLRQRWRSLLPYTLRLDLTIERVERHRLLVGRAAGDLDGTCSWTFEPAGGGTRVLFAMDVRPVPAWMNLPVPFADRIAAANYDAIMRWGGSGLSTALAGSGGGAVAAIGAAG